MSRILDIRPHNENLLPCGSGCPSRASKKEVYSSQIPLSTSSACSVDNHSQNTPLAHPLQCVIPAKAGIQYCAPLIHTLIQGHIAKNSRAKRKLRYKYLLSVIENEKERSRSAQARFGFRWCHHTDKAVRRDKQSIDGEKPSKEELRAQPRTWRRSPAPAPPTAEQAPHGRQPHRRSHHQRRENPP